MIKPLIIGFDLFIRFVDNKVNIGSQAYPLSSIFVRVSTPQSSGKIHNIRKYELLLVIHCKSFFFYLLRVCTFQPQDTLEMVSHN